MNYWKPMGEEGPHEYTLRLRSLRLTDASHVHLLHRDVPRRLRGRSRHTCVHDRTRGPPSLSPSPTRKRPSSRKSAERPQRTCAVEQLTPKPSAPVLPRDKVWGTSHPSTYGSHALISRAAQPSLAFLRGSVARLTSSVARLLEMSL